MFNPLGFASSGVLDKSSLGEATCGCGCTGTVSVTVGGIRIIVKF